MMTREKWLKAAEVVDAFRIFPRILLGGYCWFVVELTDRLLDWYTALPLGERSVEASGMAVGLFTAVVGFGTGFLNTYVNSGRKWNGSVPNVHKD
jgi:hypothetical protein